MQTKGKRGYFSTHANMFFAIILTRQGNKIHFSFQWYLFFGQCSSNTRSFSIMQSDLTFGFQPPKPSQNSTVSGSEWNRSLKMDIPKEKFIKNQNVKFYWYIFNTSWVACTQTLENEIEYNLTVYLWRYIQIPITLELNHMGP